MAAAGILARVLPGADPRALAPLVHLEARPAPRRAGSAASPRSAGTPTGPRPCAWPAPTRRALDATAAALAAGEPPAAAAYRHGAEAARDAALIRAASLGEPPPAGLEAEIARGAAARLPAARRRPRPCAARRSARR